ncbi:MAG: asparagine synthase (glutamine-hydrolyzing) [Flavobacteriales bacterium TMED235]|nr:MAG: asparagine synthase (glutamine-hydrolyzing) [Flavobacteriales bacterium TMED235]|tara:strand:+ start:1253 stop:3058 length:1806 start_codon:yes stop_codon:yes gene_type:complete
MCGIAGIINFNKINVKKYDLKLMVSKILHRGPDGENYWINNNIGFGHCRLAIIDKSSKGSQPMISFDGRYVLSYNGEVYNFKELKKILEKKYKFRSNSDTEVVLYSLIEWGTNALNKFNGMFALSFFDRKKQELMLARDRYGIKPLYVFKNHKLFAFASEQKSLVALPDFKKEINFNSISEYFTFQNILSKNTFFKNIEVFEAGSFLKYSLKNKKFTIEKYWEYNFRKKQNKKKENEYIEELKKLHENAINSQLVSDVKVGSYLSGGIDSSSITYIASKNINKFDTFNCGFQTRLISNKEKKFDETFKAKIICKYLKTKNHKFLIEPKHIEKSLNSIAYHLEEPRVGQSYPNYYASKLASKHVKVALSGIGGDEFFGGYPWRYLTGLKINNYNEFINKYYKIWQRLITEDNKKKFFSPIWGNIKTQNNKEIFKNIFKGLNKKINNDTDIINLSLHFEAKTFLKGLLILDDKLSMCHGIENRVPFLDNNLVDFAMTCPADLKIKNFYNNRGKYILRKMLKKNLPKEIYTNRKQGFSGPDNSWFKNQNKNFVKNTLNNKNIIFNIIDKNEVNKILENHFNNKANNRLIIWSLIYFNEWLKINF